MDWIDRIILLPDGWSYTVLSMDQERRSESFLGPQSRLSVTPLRHRHRWWLSVAIIVFLKYFSIFETHTVISQLVGVFTGLLTVLTGLDNIFWSKIYQRKIFKLFKHFYQLDKDFQRAGFDLNYGMVKTAGGVLMTIDVLLSLSLMFVHTMFDKDTIKITLDTQVVVVFLFTFIFWSQATFYCQYVLFTNTARLMFLQIDHELNSKNISVIAFVAIFTQNCATLLDLRTSSTRFRLFGCLLRALCW